jgi:hypothetical protein
MPSSSPAKKPMKQPKKNIAQAPATTIHAGNVHSTLISFLWCPEYRVPVIPRRGVDGGA